LEKQYVSHNPSVSVALVIQLAMRTHRYIVICGLSGSRMFFHIISSMERFLKKIIENKISVLIFSKISFETFLVLRRIE